MFLHGGHKRSQEFVLGEALLRAEIRGRRPRAGEEFLGRGQRAPSTSARGSGEHCKLPQRGPEQSPGKICVLDALRAHSVFIQIRVLWRQMLCQSGTLGGRGIAPVPSPGYAYDGVCLTVGYFTRQLPYILSERSIKFSIVMQENDALTAHLRTPLLLQNAN